MLFLWYMSQWGYITKQKEVTIILIGATSDDVTNVILEFIGIDIILKVKDTGGTFHTKSKDTGGFIKIKNINLLSHTNLKKQENPQPAANPPKEKVVNADN